MPLQAREGRVLAVLAREVHFRTRFGWQRVPAGYVTDFASVPRFAAWRIHPLDRHAWAALLHDWRYAVAQPGHKVIADEMFRERMELDGVWQPRRTLMYRAVKLGGGGGYARAPGWWETQNFADPLTGLPAPPPFAREAAFDGGEHGLVDDLYYDRFLRDV